MQAYDLAERGQMSGSPAECIMRILYIHNLGSKDGRSDGKTDGQEDSWAAIQDRWTNTGVNKHEKKRTDK